jgi:CRP/FNR family transcriptional regulator, cyclic AMP receptor protein
MVRHDGQFSASKSMRTRMAGLRPFNLQLFLTKVGRGKTILKLKSNEIVCSQGDTADAVFYITDGKIKLWVVSQKAKKQWWQF